MISKFLVITIPLVTCMACFIGAYLYFCLATNRLRRAENLKNEITVLLNGIVEAFGQNGRNGFLHAIRAANPARNFSTMSRRILKIGEEYGETCEAFLVSTTTRPTRKVKAYADVREELIDTGIVALDCALTRFPGEEDLTDEDVEAIVMEMLARKLQKWRANVDTTLIPRG